MQGRHFKRRKGDVAKKQQPVSPLLCLGTDVVSNVLIRLACTLEPGGVRGPSLVARDLAAAAQVCKQFRTAAQRGFEQLAELVHSQLQQQMGMPTNLTETQQAVFMEFYGSVLEHPALHLLPPTDAADPDLEPAVKRELAEVAETQGETPSSPDDDDRNDQISKRKQTWAYWDAIVSCPASMGYYDLINAVLKLDLPLHYPTRSLDVREVVPLTNAHLLKSVLSVFGVSGATPVPAVVLAAVARERISYELVCDGPDTCAELNAALLDLAVCARHAYIPLGIKAQHWGYGQRRPPGWPKHQQVPARFKGIAHSVKGGLAAIRSGLAAAGVHSLQQLQQMAAAELHRVGSLKMHIDLEMYAELHGEAADQATDEEERCMQHQKQHEQQHEKQLMKVERLFADILDELAPQLGVALAPKAAEVLSKEALSKESLQETFFQILMLMNNRLLEVLGEHTEPPPAALGPGAGLIELMQRNARWTQLLSSSLDGITRLRSAIATLKDKAGDFDPDRAAAADLARKKRQKLLRKQKHVSAAWKKEKKAAQQLKLAGQMRKFDQVMCSCGEVAAKHCARGSCARCCITAAIAAAAGAQQHGASAQQQQQQQQVVCLRHKVCKQCSSMEAAKHCVRGCCAYCCGRAAAAEGRAGPCIKH